MSKDRESSPSRKPMTAPKSALPEEVSEGANAVTPESIEALCRAARGPTTIAQLAKRAKAAKQVAPAKKSNPAKPPAKVYILFGADEYAKPRAARFSAEDPELLAKAAASMYLRLVEVTDPDVAEIAAMLPAGRLHANGKGLVPYIKGDLYNDLLVATLANQSPQPNPDPAPQDLPGTWDEIAPGHLVIAREALEIGWWEAVVIERNGDLVTVRYRDYPQYPPMVRHRSAIALISPAAK